MRDAVGEEPELRDEDEPVHVHPEVERDRHPALLQAKELRVHAERERAERRDPGQPFPAGAAPRETREKDRRHGGERPDRQEHVRQLGGGQLGEEEGVPHRLDERVGAGDSAQNQAQRDGAAGLVGPQLEPPRPAREQHANRPHRQAPVDLCHTRPPILGGMDTRQRGLIILLATLLGGSAFSLTPAALAESAAAASDSAFASEDSVAAGNLAASTGVPWNPPQALSSGEPWEQALRFPGFLLSLPLVVLGSITDHALIAAEDTKFFPKAIAIAQYPSSRGLIILPATLGDRTGIGVAARLYPPGIGKYFNIEWQGTTLQYSRTTLRAGRGPLILDYEFEWRPQDLFFGLGPKSSTKNESNFAGESQHLLLTLSLRRRLGRARLETQAWGGERSLVTREGKADDRPSIEQIFPIYASA